MTDVPALIFIIKEKSKGHTSWEIAEINCLENDAVMAWV